MPLRITGGEWKGRSLSVPRDIRATEAKVRQALFNILGPSVRGARVVDGFAGSGAFGFEALSRGAAFVTFIESDAEAVVSIRDNLERLAVELPREAWRLVQLEMSRGLRQVAKLEPPFDVVLFDPPYASDEAKKALNAVVEYAMLAPAGRVVVEHDQRTVLPASVGPLRQEKRHRYGDTVLSFYRLAGSSRSQTSKTARPAERAEPPYEDPRHLPRDLRPRHLRTHRPHQARAPSL